MNLLAFFATILLGPLTFAFWSRWVYRHRKTYKWPVGLVDSLGDGLFLPVFNALAFGFGLPYVPERAALVTLGTLIVALVYYRIARSTPTNWSKTEDSHLNAGGWYHFVFLTVQSGIILYTLLTYPDSAVLWFVILAFIATLIYYFVVQLPRRQVVEGVV